MKETIYPLDLETSQSISDKLDRNYSKIERKKSHKLQGKWHYLCYDFKSLLSILKKFGKAEVIKENNLKYILKFTGESGLSSGVASGFLAYLVLSG